MSMPAENLNAVPTLAMLLEGYADAPPVEVMDMTIDSRRVANGCVFIAVQGLNQHGIDHAATAIERGAAAIVYDASTAAAPAVETSIPVVGVEGLAGVIGDIANRFFGYPSTEFAVYGVTGTNGKSTVAWMLARAYPILGRIAGYSGTLGQGVAEFPIGETMTSPDVIELNRRLRAFRDAGASAAAIEVSSHALDQGRVDGIEFEATLLTNLSRDHLDYHGDMRAYGAAKAKLFLDHPASHRIVNIDTDFGRDLASRLEEDVITVSLKGSFEGVREASLEASAFAEGASGSRVNIRSVFGDAHFLLGLPGHYNAANAALAIACLCAGGVALDDACAALAAIEAPPGRMQRVCGGNDLPGVFVDYAHTPDALDVALTALREHTAGQLWCVFGCGGDRDKGKRPLMGQVAEQRADRLVVTSDNPRSEPPANIINDILAGLANAGSATVIEDRGEAIARAISEAAPGDVVLIAGKGHEDYQLIGGARLDFSDYATAQAAMAGRGNREST